MSTQAANTSPSTGEALARVVEAFEHLSPERVEALGRLYAPEARFKDPFNDVRGRAAIERVFRHMYAQVESPRFVVSRSFQAAGAAAIEWVMEYRARGAARGPLRRIRGMTVLSFDAAGLVAEHRDYWDAAEELYAGLPLIGALMRWLARRLAA